MSSDLLNKKYFSKFHTKNENLKDNEKNIIGFSIISTLCLSAKNVECEVTSQTDKIL